ncbi:MAG: YegP family protein [Treponema sp.]|nr:YegP family protein [Treponema sp.]
MVFRKKFFNSFCNLILKAGNGEIIASGEGYTAKQGVKNGIESIKKNAPTAEIVDKTVE